MSVKQTNKIGIILALALLIAALCSNAAYALCVACPGAGYSCGLLPAGPGPCPKPEQYKVWQQCLKDNGIIHIQEYNAKNEPLTSACVQERRDQFESARKKCSEDPDPGCYNKYTSKSQIPNDSVEKCLAARGITLPPTTNVYELMDRRNNPAVQECDKIPHGSQ